MNKVILMGRLCADPEVRYSQNENQTAVARYRLAVDRRFKREGDQTADFIPCVAFGKAAQFAEYYLHRGTKIIITGRIQTGSYTNKDSLMRRLVELQYRRNDIERGRGTVRVRGGNGGGAAPQAADPDGFMNIPDDIGEELPFN